MFFFLFPVRDEYRVKRFPLVVTLIIAVNCVIYFAYGFSPRYPEIVSHFGFTPRDFSPVTLFTSMFLHGGVFHLGFNMWYLWLLGDNLEDRWGKPFFLFFYLAAGVFAAVLYTVLIPDRLRGIPMIGASGAIAGVLGAYAVLFPRSRIYFKYLFIFLFFPRIGEFRLPAWVWLAFWFLQQILSSVLTAANVMARSVAFAAHLAGFVFGATVAVGARFYRSAQYRENVACGKNALLNLLGRREQQPHELTDKFEMSTAVENTCALARTDMPRAAAVYETVLRRYPETTLPPKLQFDMARTFERQGKREPARLSYANFVSAYPTSKLADNALLALGKHFLEEGDAEKAKYAFMQIVVFYPYSDTYEEAKAILERKILAPPRE